ncbi:MAG TPA: PilZ domain-containing protein [Thermodesulfovibrionales bacterium]|nr:PilZ domain-containing protein [Thermodesulfovibrionales bacterium]
MREHERITASTPVSLRFRSNQVRGNLIDISLGGLSSYFSRKNTLPQILEKIVIDLKDDEGQQQVSGIEGFTIRIQAAEAVLDSERIKIAVKFLAMSPEKKERLEAFLVSLKTHVAD